MIDFLLSQLIDIYWEIYGTYLITCENQIRYKSHINGVSTTRIGGNSSISGYSKFEGKKISLSDHDLTNGCRLGIDTHADTSCAGRHIRILEYVDGPTYNVAPFHSNYKPLEKSE